VSVEQEVGGSSPPSCTIQITEITTESLSDCLLYRRHASRGSTRNEIPDLSEAIPDQHRASGRKDLVSPVRAAEQGMRIRDSRSGTVLSGTVLASGALTISSTKGPGRGAATAALRSRLTPGNRLKQPTAKPWPQRFAKKIETATAFFVAMGMAEYEAPAALPAKKRIDDIRKKAIKLNNDVS
jgi:hypothetical protein